MRLVLWAAVLVSAAACGAGQSGKEPAVTAPDSITVTSTAFRDGETIPRKYTCDGAGVAPPLTWKQIPANAAALAVVVDDPDAPRGTFTHWVVLDLEATAATLAEGGTHHYRFTVYALSGPTGLPNGADVGEALEAIDGKSIARGRLTAVYARQ